MRQLAGDYNGLLCSGCGLDVTMACYVVGVIYDVNGLLCSGCGLDAMPCYVVIIGMVHDVTMACYVVGVVYDVTMACYVVGVVCDVTMATMLYNSCLHEI